MSGLGRTLTVWSMANITSLLGTLGIVGSLIFVGFEIQQNQNIAMASQLQERNAALMAFYSAPLEGSLDCFKTNGGWNRTRYRLVQR